MNIHSFLDQLKGVERRWDQCREQRERREELQKHPERNWKEIDEPGRILRRLVSLRLSQVVAEGMVADPSFNPLERIIAENELQSSDFLFEGAQIAKSTGRIVIRSAGGQTLGFGTGFMVSPRLILTNNHVIGSANEARHSIVQFNFYEEDGLPTEVIQHTLQPEVFFETSSALDFTIVAVEAVNTDGDELASLGWSPLIRESGKSVMGERVNVVQHPGGEHQQIAIRGNRVVDLLPDFLHYTSDTRRGSSGSGVYNDQWELAALHHAGVPKKDDQGRILLVSGQVWDGRSDTVGDIEWRANEGVRISRIVEQLELRGQRHSAAKRRLFEQVFEQPERFLFGPGAAIRDDELIPTDRRLELEDGRAVWTIPLQVSVALGDSSSPEHDSSTPIGHDATPISATPRPSEDDPDYAASLRAIEDYARHPYYQEQEDEEARWEYYEELPWELTGRRLFRALNRLLTDTHANDHPYRTIRHQYLYPWVDLQETDTGRELRSIYSGRDFDPAEVVRADFEIEARREAMRREFFASERALDEDTIAEFLDGLEASNPYNCEHVVCQSWFGGHRPQKTDLHHLFTCESDCNSFRSNVPYYQFNPEEERFREDCGERSDDKFEPASGKGAVARATLYFLLRYPGAVGDEARELQRERLDILLEWHSAHPATRYELHRNAAIFEIQGNRNPLIDYPDWAEKADFGLGFGSS